MRLRQYSHSHPPSFSLPCGCMRRTNLYEYYVMTTALREERPPPRVIVRPVLVRDHAPAPGYRSRPAVGHTWLALVSIGDTLARRSGLKNSLLLSPLSYPPLVAERRELPVSLLLITDPHNLTGSKNEDHRPFCSTCRNICLYHIRIYPPPRSWLVVLAQDRYPCARSGDLFLIHGNEVRKNRV